MAGIFMHMHMAGDFLHELQHILHMLGAHMHIMPFLLQVMHMQRLIIGMVIFSSWHMQDWGIC